MTSRPDEELQLYCQLTDEEQRLKGVQLASYELQHAELEAEMKAKAAEYKAKLDVLRSKARLVANEVDQQRELRPVRCRWVMLRENWELQRTDGGERRDGEHVVVNTAPITMADRQAELALS